MAGVVRNVSRATCNWYVDDPGDVIKTRELALDELDRMQRLVEELMVLAKASRPDFIRLEEVALEELIYAVFEKVSPIADCRWTVDAVSESTGWLDPQRITQALLQLVASAVGFTEPGAVIPLVCRTDGTEHRLWVRDAVPESIRLTRIDLRALPPRRAGERTGAPRTAAPASVCR